MKRKSALIAMALLFGAAAMAQTAPAPAPKPVHQPGVAAPQAASSAKPTSTKIDPAKEAAIRKLMDITQSVKLGENINTYIANQVQGGIGHVIAPDKVPQFMSTFNQKLAVAAPPSAVAAAMIPIYDKALSLEDIQGLNQFYESPLGQRTLKALPQVVVETENMGTQMQQKAAMSVLQGMSTDYPELKAMLGPGPGGAGGGPETPGK